MGCSNSTSFNIIKPTPTQAINSPIYVHNPIKKVEKILSGEKKSIEVENGSCFGENALNSSLDFPIVPEKYKKLVKSPINPEKQEKHRALSQKTGKYKKNQIASEKYQKSEISMKDEKKEKNTKIEGIGSYKESNFSGQSSENFQKFDKFYRILKFQNLKKIEKYEEEKLSNFRSEKKKEQSLVSINILNKNIKTMSSVSSLSGSFESIHIPKNSKRSKKSKKLDFDEISLPPSASDFFNSERTIRRKYPPQKTKNNVVFKESPQEKTKTIIKNGGEERIHLGIRDEQMKKTEGQYKYPSMSPVRRKGGLVFLEQFQGQETRQSSRRVTHHGAYHALKDKDNGLCDYGRTKISLLSIQNNKEKELLHENQRVQTQPLQEENTPSNLKSTPQVTTLISECQKTNSKPTKRHLGNSSPMLLRSASKISKSFQQRMLKLGTKPKKISDFTNSGEKMSPLSIQRGRLVNGQEQREETPSKFFEASLNGASNIFELKCRSSIKKQSKIGRPTLPMFLPMNLNQSDKSIKTPKSQFFSSHTHKNLYKNDKNKYRNGFNPIVGSKNSLKNCKSSFEQIQYSKTPKVTCRQKQFFHKNSQLSPRSKDKEKSYPSIPNLKNARKTEKYFALSPKVNSKRAGTGFTNYLAENLQSPSSPIIPQKVPQRRKIISSAFKYQEMDAFDITESSISSSSSNCRSYLESNPSDKMTIKAFEQLTERHLKNKERMAQLKSSFVFSNQRPKDSLKLKGSDSQQLKNLSQSPSEQGVRYNGNSGSTCNFIHLYQCK